MKRYLNILRNHPRRLRFALARLLVFTRLCRLFTIPQQGYRIRFHPANLPTNLWIDPTSRQEALAFFNAYLKRGDQVLDVGANVGDTVLNAAIRVGPTGHVTGIEAHPRTFCFLEDNVKLNQTANVTLIHSAAGDRQGTVCFSDSRYDDMNQVNHGSLEVPINRLDDLVASTEPLALLKVDVEGYERPVFQGAWRLLSQAACLYFEVGDKMCRDFGYTAQELFADIRAHGFRLFIHAGNGALASLRAEQSFTPYQNVIAVRDIEDLARRTGWGIPA